jgi:putative colanic acid biosynthesis acetyltransferase WcaF
MSSNSAQSSLNDATSHRHPLASQQITLGDRVLRATWNVAWGFFGRLSPVRLHGWRSFLARRFGADIGRGVHIYPRATIWAPWNLSMGDRSCLADGVGCYNVALIQIGEEVVISQDAYLCTATHDYNDRSFPLLAAPIVIESHAWIAAGAFLSPGITVHRGAVVGARAVVTSNVPAWCVLAGNPARVVNTRKNFDAPQFDSVSPYND